MAKIAILADVHLHDLLGGYGICRTGGLALRTFADTMASTRVFNESRPALLTALDQIAASDIRDIILLGDFSDDGQPGAGSALRLILKDYETRFGLHFYATFGNHDAFGPVTKPLTKSLSDETGAPVLVVTSDRSEPKPNCLVPGQRGLSTRTQMRAMARFGLMRGEHVEHWETPFGTSDRIEDRLQPNPYGAVLADASYLVEPVPGLWVLMIDANVFTPTGRDWHLNSDAAWDVVLRERPYIEPWLRAVVARARAQGKTLIACSHYPVVPYPLDADGQLQATPEWHIRMPSFDVARRLADIGITLHFSGHMHVAARSQRNGLTNIAVPSLVAWPAGFCTVETTDTGPRVETVPLADVAGFDVAFAAYQAQTPGGHPALTAQTYNAFLQSHLLELVPGRFMQRDWPDITSADLDRPLDDLCDMVPSTAHPYRAQDAMNTFYVLRAAAGLRDWPGPMFSHAKALHSAIIRAKPDAPKDWQTIIAAIVRADFGER